MKNEDRVPARAMQEFGIYAENPVENLRRQNAIPIANVGQLTRFNQGDLSCIARDRVQIVGCENHRFACLGQRSAKIQNFEAVLNVEARRRLVQEYNLRFNGKTPRNRDTLALASGKGRHEASP